MVARDKSGRAAAAVAGLIAIADDDAGVFVHVSAAAPSPVKHLRMGHYHAREELV
jgi:cold shock CspA family protein